jgi:hypothetical protein
MSDERKEDTQSAGEAMGTFEKPAQPIDLDAVGAEHLRRSLIFSAVGVRPALKP